MNLFLTLSFLCRHIQWLPRGALLTSSTDYVGRKYGKMKARESECIVADGESLSGRPLGDMTDRLIGDASDGVRGFREDWLPSSCQRGDWVMNGAAWGSSSGPF